MTHSVACLHLARRDRPRVQRDGPVNLVMDTDPVSYVPTRATLNRQRAVMDQEMLHGALSEPNADARARP